MASLLRSREATTTTMLAAVAAALLGPALVRATTSLPPSGELTCERAAIGECDFRDPTSRFAFDWPSDWPARRLKVVTETGPRARARQLDAVRWISVEYVPDDPTQPEASLLQVTVLERADWIAQWTRRNAVVAAGVEVASGGQFVAIAWTQASNPYPPESRDADIFEALRPTAADVSRLVRFVAAAPR
ncbi:MAG: hypothetical protein K0R70_1057 [Steroidobacteraceae bacterium]|nr:hypothetical protein [Steroidobacteraceae bacterium]